jgi:hypothetical protein
MQACWLWDARSLTGLEYLDNELQILEKAQHGRLEALRDKVVIYLEKGIGK